MDVMLIPPLVVAAILPYLMALLAKGNGFGLKDNHNPRAWLEKQTGWQQRANWAQQNGFETFPAFAAGVIVAGVCAEGPSLLLTGLAWAFVAARLAYNLCYVKDWASPRSAFFFLNQACTTALLVSPFFL